MKTHFAFQSKEYKGGPFGYLEPSRSSIEILDFLKPKVVQIYNQYTRDIPDLAKEANLDTLEKHLRTFIPDNLRLKKSEFGEILATVLMEDFKGRLVPIYKHSHKTSANVPFFGMDCIAFEISEEKPLRVFMCESKITEENVDRPTVSYKIRDSFRGFNEEKFALEISFILNQLKIQQKIELAAKLEKLVFDEEAGILCAILTVDKPAYKDTFLDPFVSEKYAWDIETTVISFDGLESFYKSLMVK